MVPNSRTPYHADRRGVRLGRACRRSVAFRCPALVRYAQRLGLEFWKVTTRINREADHRPVMPKRTSSTIQKRLFEKQFPYAQQAAGQIRL